MYTSAPMRPTRSESTWKSIGLGAAGSLAASAATSAIAALWGEKIGWTGMTLLAGGAIFLVLLPVVAGIARLYRQTVESELRPLIEEEVAVRSRDAAAADVRADLTRRIGIVAVYDNFLQAEAEILEHLSKSRDVRVFIQFGRAVLSGATTGTSNFYDYLSDTELKREANVKILHAAIDNPYLTERAAVDRRSDYGEWVKDLEYAADKCEVLARKLAGSRITFSSRAHREGFLWRLFLLDDIAYVQPYLHHKKNAAQAAVLKISRTLAAPDGSLVRNENSIFKVFSDYFDFKWNESRPTETSLLELTREGGVAAVAALTRFRQYYVFIVPKRYIDRDDRDVQFHGIGGKRNDDEDWIAALQREAREEVAAGLRVASSSRTRYYTTGAELGTIAVTDTPRPYCVYKRLREDDPHFAHKDVLWLVGYEASLDSTEFAQPQAEAAAVLYMSRDMLVLSMVTGVTFRDIKKDPDCRLLVRDGVNLDLSRRAVPGGIAAIAAASERPRALRRL